MNRKNLITLLLVPLLLVLTSTTMTTGDPDPIEIIRKAEAKNNGNSNKGEIKMTIVRPTWKREMRLKSWSKGTDFSLILITAPARDQGTAFLKREKEIWNWQPKIDREIKLPPSMMSQSWMGSDFTNDDLVQQSSLVEDFTHRLLDSEMVEGRDCYKIELQPKEEAAVVWGKIIMWIDKVDYLELKTEFYDEDEYLVNTMLGKDIQLLGGRLLPGTLEVIPADEPGHKTIIEQLSIEFDIDLSDSFFSVQNMKRVR